MERQRTEFGIPPEMLAQMLADRARADEGDDDEGRVEIWPENADAARLFFALGTQWRAASLSTWGQAVVVKTGLDYGVVDRVAGWLAIAVTEGLFLQLRTIEQAALGAMDRLRDQAFR